MTTNATKSALSREQDALDKLVDDFAAEMKAKLTSKLCDGWNGWRDKALADEMHRNLLHHAVGGDDGFGGRYIDFVDVANFAAFLWNLKGRPEST